MKIQKRFFIPAAAILGLMFLTGCSDPVKTADACLKAFYMGDTVRFLQCVDLGPIKDRPDEINEITARVRALKESREQKFGLVRNVVCKEAQFNADKTRATVKCTSVYVNEKVKPDEKLFTLIKSAGHWYFDLNQ